jgi:phenylacetate-CoA ligase
VARIEAERPTVLMAYGSYLDLLLRWVATRGRLRHRPAAVLYGADALSAEGRQCLERDLGVRVLSTYSAAEAFKIGFTCEAGEHFHVHADLCHLRLVDERGDDVPVGVPGEVVLSNLANHATVLLNYRLGDLAILSDERCACGRTLPVLTALAGRSEDTVELPGGGVLHPRSVWGLVKDHPEVMRFQMVQYEPDRLELRLMTPDRAAYERAAPRIVTALRALVPHARSDVSFAPDLGVGEPGKFRTVVALQRATGRAAEQT